MKKIRSERGAIVVEASLSLTFFLFAIIIVYATYHAAVAQARINSALHSAAKEISQYAYVYDLTGLNEKQREVSSKSGAAINELDDNLSDVRNVYDAINGVSGAGKAIITDSDKTKSFLYFIFDEGIDAAKGWITGEASKALMGKHFGDNPDEFLTHLGVKGGLSGLNLSNSRVFVSGKEKEVVLVCNYDISVLKLMGMDYTMHFVVCAKTRAWVGSD